MLRSDGEPPAKVDVISAGLARVEAPWRRPRTGANAAEFVSLNHIAKPVTHQMVEKASVISSWTTTTKRAGSPFSGG
jgi:hypothetical protein